MKPDPAEEVRHLRDLLAAVREALTIPYPATGGDHERYLAVLEERVMHTRVTLDVLLDEENSVRPELRCGQVAYLRRRLAEHPPTGYRHWQRPQRSPEAPPPDRAGAE